MIDFQLHLMCNFQGSAVLLSFAIQPEKALDPVNSRKSAAASNAHNLNILERRDSVVLVPAEAVLSSSSCSSAHSAGSMGAVAVGASLPSDSVRSTACACRDCANM